MLRSNKSHFEMFLKDKTELGCCLLICWVFVCLFLINVALHLIGKAMV